MISLKKILIATICLMVACSSPNYKNPHVVIQTNFGDIELELYPDKAPKTVATFLSYIDAGYYKPGSFYRVLNKDNQPSGSNQSELIQGGIWKTNHARATTLLGIQHETTRQTKISHINGVVSMAREAPGSATTEFFICIGDQTGFDYGGENNPDGQGYAAFGKVFSGMEIVMDIYKQHEEEQSFDPAIVIKNIVRK